MGSSTTMASQVQISTSKMSLKLCLSLAVVALLATAIPLVGANTSAGFVLGTQGSNVVCPAGSVSVGTEDECRSAATALEYPWTSQSQTVVDENHLPPGCILYEPRRGPMQVYFNTHQTGGAAENVTPICMNEPSNEPTAYVQGPISTTCYDLKSSYQNNSCCSQDTGKAATFNGTNVTCGNVLSSYKSSECCSADGAKNATMIFPTNAPTNAPSSIPSSEPTSLPSNEATSMPSNEATSSH